jgi:cation transport protein ChaC
MEQFWIFGYGSLMWRPGFSYIASEPAVIYGYHRRLCVYSHVHRGTPQSPGVVLGLDRGGSGHGMAFRIAPECWDDTLAYLRSREQVTMVYRERQSPVKTLRSARRVNATTYVVDRTHHQYAGTVSEDKLFSLARNGQGVSGRCTDYILSTVTHLREMNIHDATLEALARRLELQTKDS